MINQFWPSTHRLHAAARRRSAMQATLAAALEVVLVLQAGADAIETWWPTNLIWVGWGCASI